MDTDHIDELRAQLLHRHRRLKEIASDSPAATQIVHLIREVESTLERLNDGSYGVCEMCKEPIEAEYLNADQLARICLSHLSEDQQRAFERDLDLAFRIQANLLPSPKQELPGWETYYHYEPAGPVSGDYCDVIAPTRERDCIHFMLGDVSGKGVSASLLMSHLHAIFHSLVGIQQPLNVLLEQVNRVFSESTLSSQFATLVAGRAKYSGDIELCNAGHCPPLLIRNGVVTSLASTGLPLGLFFSGTYGAITVHLDVGDTLLLYTDGLTEARDPAENEYGEERLTSLLTQSDSLSPQQVITRCLEHWRTFRAGRAKIDDLTVLALRRVS